MSRTLWQRFIEDTNGVSAVEYGVLIATIVILMSAGLVLFPPALQAVFTTIATAISSI